MNNRYDCCSSECTRRQLQRRRRFKQGEDSRSIILQGSKDKILSSFHNHRRTRKEILSTKEQEEKGENNENRVTT